MCIRDSISYISTKSNKARAFFAGKPIILMTNGRLSKAKMKKARLDVNELLAMARIAGFYDLSQIETAIFEQNGNVSFLPKSLYRPATPLSLIHICAFSCNETQDLYFYRWSACHVLFRNYIASKFYLCFWPS